MELIYIKYRKTSKFLIKIIEFEIKNLNLDVIKKILKKAPEKSINFGALLRIRYDLLQFFSGIINCTGIFCNLGKIIGCISLNYKINIQKFRTCRKHFNLRGMPVTGSRRLNCYHDKYLGEEKQVVRPKEVSEKYLEEEKQAVRPKEVGRKYLE
ncbi:MAG: hypothetical protein IKW28_10040, partial [Lachnospiraceae bacterium]|nr:hypothetical protein [Lachnospiraceae bacterium]